MKCELLVAMAVFALVGAGKDCPSPQLENGIVTGSSNANMFVGKFSCNPGYHLVGNKVVKCRQGTWTNRIPVCIKVGTCPELPEIPNGSKIVVKGSRGSMFRFKCRAGFLRLGAQRLYCTGTRWSAEMPVCAKASCEANGMDNIEGGFSAKIMGGAMYRYQCTEGAEMTGSSVVYCDGSSWNDTAPTCLGAPGPVKVQTWVNGAETSHVKVGDFVTVTCTSIGGFPPPKITIFKNFKLVADSATMRKPYFTFAATARDNNADIACFSKNKAADQPQEDHTRLTVTFAPTTVMVGGLTAVRRGHVYQYICRSEAASPPPTLVWSVTDYRGQTKEVAVDNKDPVYVHGGWEASSSMELQTAHDERDISITCRAANTQGRVSHTINIKTEYMPEKLVLSGPSSMSHGEEATLTCTTSPSHPTPTLLWKIIKIRGEEEEEQRLVEGDALSKEAKDGDMSVKSVLKVTDVGKDVDRVVVKCLARLNGMEDVHSELKNVDIRGPPGLPVMTGIQTGSSIPEGSHHNLTCRAAAGKPEAAIVWSKGGAVVHGVEWHAEGGEVVSQWRYTAEVGDTQIGCMVSNAVTKEPFITTIKVEVIQEEIEDPTEKLEVVEQFEFEAMESEEKFEHISSKKYTTEETTFEKATNKSWAFENEIEVSDNNNHIKEENTFIGSNDHQQNDKDKEENYELPKQEISNEVKVTQKNIEFKEEKTTKKIRWIEAPFEVTEGYYKLYDDKHEDSNEDDDDYDEPIRAQQEVPVEVVNQKASPSLNDEIQPQFSKLSNNSSPICNLSLSLMLFFSILPFICSSNLI